MKTTWAAASAAEVVAAELEGRLFRQTSPLAIGSNTYPAVTCPDCGRNYIHAVQVGRAAHRQCGACMGRYIVYVTHQ